MKTAKKTLIAFQVDNELRALLDGYCRRKCINKSSYIRRAIVEQLKRDDRRIGK